MIATSTTKTMAAIRAIRANISNRKKLDWSRMVALSDTEQGYG
jgi:hypothetical protein